MSRWIGGALIAVFALAVPSAFAEEREQPTQRIQTERPKTIKVLHEPKDISTFYSSDRSHDHRPGPYGLASYYRSSDSGRRYDAWRTYAHADGERCVHVAEPYYRSRR